MGNARDRSESGGHLYTTDERRLLADGAFVAATHALRLLSELIEVQSVVDIGCGTGAWLRAFGDVGVGDYLGLDGFDVRDADLLIPVERFRRVDLSHTFNVARRFDLVVSIEVGEHLPPGRAAGFVTDLTRLGDVVLFSAAIPGASRVAIGGRHSGHVNEQWPSYWATLFAQQDFDVFDPIRPQLWHRRDVPIALRQHVLMFCRRSVVPSALLPWAAQYLDVVHPQWVEMLEAEIEAPGLRQLAKVPKAVRRAVRRRIH